MKYFNQLATVFCSAALGLVALTSCEGGNLYNINGPDWMSEKIDSIAASKSQGGEEEEIEGLHEDVYNIGAEDLSSGFWTLGKTYVVPAGEKWQAQFNLTVNPDNKYFKNCYIVFNDYNPDTDEHLGTEYGVIRYDNDPNKNSEWGDHIDRSLVSANFSNSSGDEDTDASVQKMNGKVTVTVDRTAGGVHYTISNGTLTKEYIQPGDFPTTDPEGRLCCRIGIEGSLASFLGSTIEPIGGYTSKEDKEPVSMVLKGVPAKVLQGTDLETLVANVTAEVTFDGLPAPVTVPAEALKFEAVPDMSGLGVKTLIAAYAKTFKGEAAEKPVIGTAQFQVVDKMYECIGATDNSTPFWGAHSANVKVNSGETYCSTFYNFTSGQNNWNNFCVVLCTADGGIEYAVVRADNYGWGIGYDGNPNLVARGTQGDWPTWLAAMDGAKVNLAVTNKGDGTADIVAVMYGNNGQIYTQEYLGIANVDPENCYFNLTVDNSHIEYAEVIGAEDNSTQFWGAHSDDIQVPVGKTVTQRFRNYTSGANNWNNFCVVLTREDDTEYAVVRADNFGWGTSYDGNASLITEGTQGDWASWLAGMDDALVTVSVTNNGGSADVNIIMYGSNGGISTQKYLNIMPIDGDDLDFHLTVDNSHLILE